MESRVIYSNLTWRILERFGAKGVTFLVSIVLARFLEPEVYGIVAIVNVFIMLLEVFLDGGFSTALVQKKEASDVDFSTVFYFSLTFSVLLYALFFIAAPFIASFYKTEQLTSVIRVLGVLLIIYSVQSVQQAYVQRNMIFKKFFFSTLGGTIGAAVVGITMAVLGYGIWALVAQSIFNMLVDTLILWFTVKWRPKAVFSWKKFIELLSYGWKMFASSLLSTVINEIRQLFIGKMYSSADLAFYDQGSRIPLVLGNTINMSLTSVLFPAMAKEQDDADAVKTLTKRAITVGTYLISPMMFGLAACSEPFVRFFLTEKWLPAVPFMQIFAFVFAVYPFHIANLNATKALGRSDIYLRFEFIRKAVEAAAVISTIWFGPLVIAIGSLASSLVLMYVNSYPNKKLIGYGFLEQLGDYLPNLVLSLLMGIPVYCVRLLHLHDLVTLVLQLVLGVLIYAGLSKLFHIRGFEYITELIKNRKNPKDNKY